MSKELQIPTYVADADIAAKCYEFRKRLARQPRPERVQKTPDGKADHIPIDILQNMADSLFYLGWGTENIITSVVGNEVTCSLTLWYIHPVTGLKITHTGAAAAQITVDALTNDQKAGMSKQEINLHATTLANKKPNALFLVFPKVVIEAEKNAFKKIGNVFGRSLNRKFLGTELQADPNLDAMVEIIKSRAKEIPMDFVAMIEKCSNLSELQMLNDDYSHLFDIGTHQFEIKAMQDKRIELITPKQIK